MFTHNEKNPRPSCSSTKGDGIYMAAETNPQTTDITKLSNAEWDRCMEFYSSGYTAGVAAGRQYEHDEVATLQRDAARIVHDLAGIPPRDQEADAERRARIDARFNERRSA